MTASEDWTRVVEHIDALKRTLGTWAETYQQIGISQKTVARMRDGKPLTLDKTVNGLEDGLGWERGSARAVAQGGEPTLRQGPPPETPAAQVPTRPSTPELERLLLESSRASTELLAELRELASAQHEQLAELTRLVNRLTR